MQRVTFECSGHFKGDTGPTVVFYREGCVEMVRFITPDLREQNFTLDEFLQTMRAEKRQREGKVQP
jgi:hypothetical protein